MQQMAVEIENLQGQLRSQGTLSYSGSPSLYSNIPSEQPYPSQPTNTPANTSISVTAATTIEATSISTATTNTTITATPISSTTATPISHTTVTATTRATTRSIPLKGNLSTEGVMEWYLPQSICQSLHHGRSGSNACTLIAMSFGQLYQRDNLSLPSSGNELSSVWRKAMVEAITTGNALHDELFDGDAVNLAVDEAIDVAGDECNVQSISADYNVYGNNPLSQFKDIVDIIIEDRNSFHMLTVNDKTMLIIVDSKGTLIFIDSPKHTRHGALIATCSSVKNKACSFTAWLQDM